MSRPAPRRFTVLGKTLITPHMLRHYFKAGREVAKSDLHVSSYWKLGMNEARHKSARQQDAQQSG